MSKIRCRLAPRRNGCGCGADPKDGWFWAWTLSKLGVWDKFEPYITCLGSGHWPSKKCLGRCCLPYPGASIHLFSGGEGVMTNAAEAFPPCLVVMVLRLLFSNPLEMHHLWSWTWLCYTSTDTNTNLLILLQILILRPHHRKVFGWS